MENYPDIVLEIHKSVEEDARALKQMFYKDPEQLKFNHSKLQSLQLMGFGSAKESDKSEYGRIEEYNRLALQYPGYMIVNDNTIFRIAEKYDLVTASLNAYTGFVPKKNLEEMEKFFEIYALHNAEIEITVRATWKTEKFPVDLKGLLESGTELFKEEFPDGFTSFKGLIPTQFIKGFKTDKDAIFGTVMYTTPTMSISAPRKDIRLTSRQVIGSNRRAMNLPDPIVYLEKDHWRVVITKWGDESQDPILNSNMN